LESAFQDQAAARSEDVARTQANLTKAQADGLAALQKSHAQIVRELSEKQSAALAEIDRRLAERTAQVVAALGSVPERTGANDPLKSVGTSSHPSPSETAANQALSGHEADVASPPKRPRKARREDLPPPDGAACETPPDKTETTAPVASSSMPEPEPSAAIPASTPPPFSEPAPIPAAAIVQIAPVAPVSAEPFPRPAPTATSSPENSAASSAPVPATATPEQPAKKRPAKKAPTPDAQEPMELAGFETGDADSGVDAMEKVLSSDGATRLIATAYIGIGNRLFIRGEGPGLSWEKGVPLQFVSIGKWRWETAETAAPVRFKLYKNDDVECPGLGTVVLDPGYQQEVIAKF
jgi:hypothetical protein